jgi:hypothetical protein
MSVLVVVLAALISMGLMLKASATTLALITLQSQQQIQQIQQSNQSPSLNRSVTTNAKPVHHSQITAHNALTGEHKHQPVYSQHLYPLCILPLALPTHLGLAPPSLPTILSTTCNSTSTTPSTTVASSMKC